MNITDTTDTESKNPRPRIAKPSGTRNIHAFAQEVGEAMRRQRQWFNHHGSVALIEQSARGEMHRPLGFTTLDPWHAITALEAFIQPGVMRRDRRTGCEVFSMRSLDRSTTAKLLQSLEFTTKLPRIERILDVPVPIAMEDGFFAMPVRGYDPRFETFCDPHAPKQEDVPLNKALAVLEEAHTDFLWRNDQSRVHALARMITPYCRGLMGWRARTPLWFFSGPMGKDYLASLTEVVYQGAHSCYFTTDLRAAIGGAIRAGQRRLHMTDSYSRLSTRVLTEAVSLPFFKFKERNHEVVLPNELEIGLSHASCSMAREGLAPVSRLIQLTNTYDYRRKFKQPNLREHVLQNRAQVLGAVAALVGHWMNHGCPDGPSALEGFPEWSRVVGGVMNVNGLGDPCLPAE